MSRKLVILGAGDVGSFIAYNLDLFDTNYDAVILLDDDSSKIGSEINGFKIIDGIKNFREYIIHDMDVVIGIADPHVKKGLVETYQSFNLQFPSFIAKKAWVSHGVKIGEGAIIYPGVSINHGCTIGDFSLLNMNCAIGHDSNIGSFCFLSPGVNLGGFTKLNASVKMGIGAATRQGIEVGENCIIGGQAMLIKSTKPNSTFVGVPGKNKNE